VAVWLNCVINAAGNVTSTQTILSTDDSATPEALAVVRQWHFRPAIKAAIQSGVAILRAVLPDGIPLPRKVDPGRRHRGWAEATKLKKIPPLVIRGDADQGPARSRGSQVSGVTNGRVENAEAVAASNAAYARAAVDAVESWRFEPAQKDGQPTSYDSRVSLTSILYSY